MIAFILGMTLACDDGEDNSTPETLTTDVTTSESNDSTTSTEKSTTKTVETSDTPSGKVSTTTVAKDETKSTDNNTPETETIPAPPDNGPY